ncbi:glutamate-rich protein 1 isoform X2 [Mixophyes fleayi]|uniref:glutamate-rich protein 1 isoform X2 n=1 Tax=Mixophyes fleayi TaxID=3061075 RepID=UPI003F4DFADE
MSSARKEAFISKVLSKLYPRKDANSAAAKPPSIQLENALRLRETPVKVVKPPTAEGSDLKARDLEQEEHNRSVNAGLNHEQKRGSVVEKGSLSQQKIYTVSLPPDDYVPALQSDVKSSPTENSDLSEDLEDHPLETRRRRRRKRKVNVTTRSADDHDTGLQQAKHQSQTSECGTINKNKRRKLQRQRQKERLKAAGLWPKAKAVELVYKPEEGLVQTDAIEHPHEQTEEQQMERKDLLDFLQATQEIYFTESKSTCADSVFSTELIGEILDQIKGGAVPFSEVQSLNHLKRLLLLQDIERLKYELHSFKEHSSMPLDHTRALCSLFYYWITNILPIKAKHAV